MDEYVLMWATLGKADNAEFDLSRFLDPTEVEITSCLSEYLDQGDGVQNSSF